MKKQDMQIQLDRIEDILLQVGGYLALLQGIKAVLPPYDAELPARSDQLGEAMQAVAVIKKAEGLHSRYHVSLRTEDGQP